MTGTYTGGGAGDLVENAASALTDQVSSMTLAFGLKKPDGTGRYERTSLDKPLEAVSTPFTTAKAIADLVGAASHAQLCYASQTIAQLADTDPNNFPQDPGQDVPGSAIRMYYKDANGIDPDEKHMFTIWVPAFNASSLDAKENLAQAILAVLDGDKAAGIEFHIENNRRRDYGYNR